MHLRGTLALSALLALTLAACGGPSSKNQAKKVDKNAKASDDSPQSLTDVTFTESARGGDPATVGCADGQREGFADIAKFPTIAGCLGVWDGEMTLRKGKTSKACGDDLEICGSPADVCAPGWHLCARDGDYKDLSERVSAQECKDGAGPGKFVAGISHVLKKKECAPEPGPTTRYPCLDEGFGAEPVCCGELCGSGKCKDSVWAGGTPISVGKAQGCSAVTSDRNGGILCCKDKEAPAPVAPPVAPPTDPALPADGSVTPPPGDPTGPVEVDIGKKDEKKTDEKKADEKKADEKKADEKKAP
jgi:hypothetical protein